MAHGAHKFEHLLQTYRRPDDREWSGAELARATGGMVSRSYVTNLRKGRIENPGYAPHPCLFSFTSKKPPVSGRIFPLCATGKPVYSAVQKAFAFNTTSYQQFSTSANKPLEV